MSPTDGRANVVLEDTRVDLLPDLSVIFHRLNNQLGIILANAELLEARASDDTSRARASQVVTSVLEAMGTVRELRVTIDAAVEQDDRPHRS